MAFRDVQIKINANKQPFKKSVRQLRTRLPRVLKQALRRSARDIAANTRERFKSEYGAVHSAQAKAVLSNIRASEVFETADSLFVGIGNIEKLNRTTEVMAQSTGKTYQLWRLMEEGFGLKGGFRGDRYDIRPVASRRRSVSDKDNVLQRPALVFRVDGNLVFASRVRHPGAAGRHFFLKASNQWYREDLRNATLHVRNNVNKLLEKVNYKGNS